MPDKKIRWTRYFARKFCVQRYEIVMRVFYSDFYFKHFKKRIQSNLVIPEKGNHAIYYNEKEWIPFAEKVFQVSCRNLQSFHRFMGQVKTKQKLYVEVAKKLSQGNLEKKSWPQLRRLYLQFDKLHLDFFVSPIWVPFIIEPFIAQAAKKELIRLLKKHKLEDKFNDYFDVIFSPEEKNAVVKEHQGLLGLAITAKEKNISQSRLNQLFDLHIKKYEWLPCYDINDSPWTREYFSKELKGLLKQKKDKLSAEYKQTNRDFQRRKRKFKKVLTEVKPSPRQKALFIMAHEISFIKDERDDRRRQGSFNIQPLYRELGRRALLNIKEITQLTREEMIGFVSSGRLPVSKAIVRSRTRGYVLLRKFDQPIVVFHGREMKKIIKKELGSRKTGKDQQVKGITGSSGKAAGLVQVVYTRHDLRKVKPGDIMVSVTTHPDFVQAMRKCKAIITDEGGITCHAAIVSRELSIPCVVGTKIATHVLRDGDEIEVDAVRGLVKKI